jgi:hypothetical protein
MVNRQLKSNLTKRKAQVGMLQKSRNMVHVYHKNHFYLCYSEDIFLCIFLLGEQSLPIPCTTYFLNREIHDDVLVFRLPVPV